MRAICFFDKIFIFAVFLFSLNINIAVADDFQLWTSLSSNGPISKDSSTLFWFDGHTRYSEDAGRLGVSIVRPGIGVKVSDNLSLWTGYAWVVSQARDRENITDNRFWQQATYKIAETEVGTFSGRTRFESRFVRSGGNTGFRLRQVFKWSLPLSENWYTSFWNETFFALNDTDFGAEQGYDQNRTHIGAGYKTDSSLKIEGGYLFNHIRRVSQSDIENNNFSISISWPFS